MTLSRVLVTAAYLGCILAANYVTSRYGMVPVGFGLVATTGTYFAGASFVLRDSLQDLVRERLTREVRGRGHMAGVVEIQEPSHRAVALRVIAVIALGGILSFAIASPAIALASGLAFLASETADLTVYTPLREHGYLRAAVASNVVGSFVDTVLFLSVAGFPVWSSTPGQLAGKLTITLAVVGLVVAVKAVNRCSTSPTRADRL